MTLPPASSDPLALKPLRVVEIFHSVQGEGPSAGEAATFLRLAGCSLACSWCDTEYSWNWKRYDRDASTTSYSVEQVLERLGSPARLVATGGEPLLQGEALLALLLRTSALVEIETNGALLPSEALCERADQWNVSPKLENSGESARRRLHFDVLRRFAAHRNAWLKLVVRDEAEADEVKCLLAESRWPRERVLLQAAAATRLEL